MEEALGRTFGWEDGNYMHWTTDTGVRLDIENGWDWLVFCDIFVNREYPLSIRSKVDRPLVFVDIGANVGYFTLYTVHECRKVGQEYNIYAFEGAPHTFETLVKRMKDIPNVALHEGLIGLRYGTANMALSANHGTSIIVDENSPYPRTTLPYLNIETYLPPGPIDLIKCDIEGSEFNLVENYPELFRRTQTVYMEIHNTVGDVEKMKGQLYHYGLTGNQVLLNRETASTELFYRA